MSASGGIEFEDGFKIPYPMYNDITVYGVAYCGARGLSNVGGKEPMRKACRIWRKNLVKDMVGLVLNEEGYIKYPYDVLSQ